MTNMNDKENETIGIEENDGRDAINLSYNDNYESSSHHQDPAYAEMSKTSDEGPQESERLKGMAKNLQKTGRFQEAFDMFAKATQIDGSNPESYCNRAEAGIRVDNFHQAIDDCQKALTLDPAYSRAYQLIGAAYRNLKQYNTSLEMYAKAIELEGSNPRFYTGRAKTHDAMNNQHLAVEDYQRAINIDPSCSKICDSEFYYFRAYAHFAMKNHQLAIEECQRSLDIDPTDNETYNLKGHCYFYLKQYKEAIDMFSKGESDPAEICNIANVHIQMNNHHLAIEACHKALEIDPEFSHAYNLMGVAHKKLKHFKEAVEMLTTAIDLDGSNPDFYWNRALVHYQMENHQLANDDGQRVVDIYTKSIEHDGLNEKFYRCRAFAYLLMKNYNMTIVDCQKAINIDPGNSKPYAYMGEAYKNLKHFQEAVDSYKKALELEPDNDDYRANLKISEINLKIKNFTNFCSNAMSTLNIFKGNTN